MDFKPGELSIDEARELNRLQSEVLKLQNLRVAGPTMRIYRGPANIVIESIAAVPPQPTGSGGSGTGGGGPDNRCTGTVASVPYWRTTCIDGIEYLTSWLDTWAYNDLGCLTFTRGDSTTVAQGCCDCDTPPPPPPPPPALCADRIAAMGLQAPTMTYTFTGSCAPVAGASVTLTYDAGNNWYAYTGAVGTCSATFPFLPVNIKLSCFGNAIQLFYDSGSGVTHVFTEGDVTFPLVVVSEPPDPIYIAFQDLQDPGGPGTPWCVSPPSDCSDGAGMVVE